ncbi:MATE family efflux transporter [Clostridium sp. W14A]|nr:MATE family efflux transporter [Clostridium sp. W14A]
MVSSIWTLAWPTVLEQALQTAETYVDTAMVGRLGAGASAAVGLTTTSTWLINSPMFALSIGVLSCIAKADGAGNPKKVRTAAAQSVWLTLLSGAVLGVAGMALSPVLPIWLGVQPEIYRDAYLYFFITSMPMLMRAAMILFGGVLRAVGNTRSPLIVNVIANLINIVLNALLIYRPTKLAGGLVFPGLGLGVAGSAAATAIAQACGGILMFSAFCRDERLTPRGFGLRINRGVMKECVRVALPIAGGRVSACFGQVLFTGLVSRLGTLALATHTIALAAEEAFYVPGYGMQTAASTLAGNAAGEGSKRALRRSSLTITALAVGMMGGMSLFLFLFPSHVMRIFTRNADVVNQGAVLLRMIALSEPMFAVAIIMEGVFNGLGDTRAPLFFSIFCMWGVRIGGTVFCVRLLGLGLVAVWGCMIGDNVTRCVLLSVRFARGSWEKCFNRPCGAPDESGLDAA